MCSLNINLKSFIMGLWVKENEYLYVPKDGHNCFNCLCTVPVHVINLNKGRKNINTENWGERKGGPFF